MVEGTRLWGERIQNQVEYQDWEGARVARKQTETLLLREEEFALLLQAPTHSGF